MKGGQESVSWPAPAANRPWAPAASKQTPPHVSEGGGEVSELPGQRPQQRK